MKITINGNDITPERIAGALRSCERDGLKMAGYTIYVRYKNHQNQIIEPLDENGQECTRTFSFWKKKEVAMPNPSIDPISKDEMINLCKNRARRFLSAPEITVLIEASKSMKIDKKCFCECLDYTMNKFGSFNISYLLSVIKQKTKSTQK